MGFGATYAINAEGLPSESFGPTTSSFTNGLPAESFGPSVTITSLEGTFMGIRAKQMLAATFDATTAGRAPFGANLFDNTLATSVFAAGAIPGAKLENSTVTETQLAASVAGNGLTGGAGSALTIDPDSETGGNISPVTVGANGIGVDVNSIAGVGIEADGAAALRISAQGNGLTGGGGTVIAVGAGTGITVNANDVAINTASTVTFVSPAVWTFPVGVTAEGLFVTGTPQDANHVVNKSYVDSAISGLTWREPVHAIRVIADNVTAPPGSPAVGDSYVVASVATGAWTGLEDRLVVWDGSVWVDIEGATLAVNDRFLITGGVGTASNDAGAAAGSFATHENKIATVTGTGPLTYSFEVPSDGWAVLVDEHATPGPNDLSGYVYDSTDTAWNQFTGAGTINAGAGLTKTGNTLDVGAGNGIAVAADSVAVQADGTTGGNIQPVNVVANGVGLDVSAIAGTGLEADGSANLRLATQGTGIAGGAGTTLSFDATAADGDGLSGAGAVLTVLAATATAAQQYGGLVVNRTSNGTAAAAAGDGYLAIQTDNSTLEINASNQLAVQAAGITETQLNTSVAGAGLTGGGGAALAVGAGDGISVAADSVAVNPAHLVNGAGTTSIIDGDKLEISYAPSNYTEQTGTQGGVTGVVANDLTAHLAGIDQAISAAGGQPAQETVGTEVITGSDTALSDPLNNTPSSAASVKLFLNGILQQQGAGADYTISGTVITWLASSGTAVDMDTSDVLIAVYEF